MKAVYQKVARAVDDLVPVVKGKLMMPIGFDGAVVCHLLTEAFVKRGIPYEDQLGNTTQVSSKLDEFDVKKFETLMGKAYSDAVPLYAVDMRTVTGSLGRMLKAEVTNWQESRKRNVSLTYAVLFGIAADMSATWRELIDAERAELRWVKSSEEVSKRIRKTPKGWKYDLTHNDIHNFNHVPEIESLLLTSEMLPTKASH